MNRCAPVFLLMLMASLALASCGGAGGQSSASPSPAPPTRTPFPTFAFVEPTTAPEFEQDEDSLDTLAATEEPSPDAIELDPTKVARGLGRYQALGCAGCHGDDGTGSSQAKGLQSFNLSEENFITFVRTGGELGTIHQFSTDRLSDSGSRNLYQYLVSLAASG